jgi:hypothetical protein
MKTTTILNVTATVTAIALVAFSGSISAYGLTRFVPGAEVAIIVMAALFEVAKLIGFALVHRPAPRLLKGALLTVSIVQMVLNVCGIAGFLSNHYQQAQIAARAASHTATAGAHAESSLLERQLAQAEQAVSQARTVVRARDAGGG